ncbi:riboflavin synthase [Niabella sp. 22666]|uniref:riboflavin synthase n=1 Tax=Niabella sp. 22666 TaxID=3453954 RepID=UPI003F838D84
MFTGIIEASGIVKKVAVAGSNKTFWVESPISHELKVDQSISHNGVCLTVESVAGSTHSVTAIDETLNKTNLGTLKEGDLLNLERCMIMNGRLDGHIVQGHVDGTARCIAVSEKEGSWEYEFQFDEKFAPLVIEKGSACINGISLTVFDVKRTSFKVAIIPYTYNHTNIKQVSENSIVNIEFDVIGKYIMRSNQLNQHF